jgi:hypothetical protein
MRLWSLHPRYLDARGLVALWREALLAQAVLLGKTKGYTRHPQLERFRTPGRAPAGRADAARHRALIAAYLRAVCDEAGARGYSFAAAKIGRARARSDRLTVTRGQLDYEWRHLMAKLRRRDPKRAATLAQVERPRAHPLFRVVAGAVAPWEKVMPRTRATAPTAAIRVRR